MKREIKFRAWHKTYKVMYWFDIMNGNHGRGDGYIGMSPSGESITKTRHRDNIILVDPYECEIMQFTGLKDRNGVDIYEGDILKVGENLICEIVYIENNSNDYGDEIHSAFHANVYIHNKIIPIDGYLKNNCAIIGNIYENPELCQ